MVELFEAGGSLRDVCSGVGAALNTVARYRHEWLLGGSPEEIARRVRAIYFGNRKVATGGRYSCGRKMNEPAEPG